MDNDLPFIDEHRLLVSAPALAVWRSLATVLPGPSGLSAEILTRLLGAEPRRAAGTPLGAGATWPGVVARLLREVRRRAETPGGH